MLRPTKELAMRFQTDAIGLTALILVVVRKNSVVRKFIRVTM